MTTVTVSEDINAAAAAVWGVLGDFGGGVKVGGPVTSVAIEGKGVGMVRTIGLGGGKIVERLDVHDAKAMALRYSITNADNPLPVSQYSATIKVTDKGAGKCNVTWAGTFQPKGASEADASKVVEGIYRGGISAARKALGG